MGLLPHTKIKENMETKNLINVTNIDNIYNRALIFNRVERFVRATWQGLTPKFNERGGKVELLAGSYFMTLKARFTILSDNEGRNIFLLLERGAGFDSVWVVQDGKEGADIMADCPVFLATEKAARKNMVKPFDTLKVGDYLHGWAGWTSKNGSIIEYMQDFAAMAEDSEDNNYLPVLMRVDKIVEMTDQELDALNFWQFNGGGFEGGSLSEDAPKVGFSPLTWSQQHSFISLVCLVRTPTRWVAIDPQGYKYSRYVYFPLSWREMFAASYSQALAQIEERKRTEQEEKEAKEQEQRKEYAARAARAIALMEGAKAKVYKEGEKRTEVRLTSNLKRYLSACFPGVTFDIKKITWGHFGRSISWAGGPETKEVSTALAVMKGDEYPPEGGYYAPGEDIRYLQNEFTKRYGCLTECFLHHK